jgi:hypothetical protein
MIIRCHLVGEKDTRLPDPAPEISMTDAEDRAMRVLKAYLTAILLGCRPYDRPLR